MNLKDYKINVVLEARVEVNSEYIIEAESEQDAFDRFNQLPAEQIREAVSKKLSPPGKVKWIDYESLEFDLKEIKLCPSRLRDYRQPVQPNRDNDIYSADDFERAIEDGSFTSDDGSGYWVKDGFRSYDEIFRTERLDATHVIWFSK